MPSFSPVFSGLGSGSVFSEENLGRAEENALSLECAVLLQSCHRTFREQVSDAIARNILSEDSIDLNDLAKPGSLIRPLTKYSRNVVTQHAALYLHQILAYMTSHKELGDLIGSAGFCTGLLPAAVAAASQTSVITLISQSHHFFQVALWIGIRSEQYRVNHLTNDTRDADGESLLPCSYVLEGVSEAAAAELLHKSNMGNDVFVSAILSPTRVTLSGIPSKLSTLISKHLPTNCRTTAAVVHSLYHHERLGEVRDLVMADLNRQDELLRAKVELAAPVLSTKTGQPLALSSVTTLEEVAGAILDLIFIEKDALDRPINIVNYGPGLGMAPSAFPQAQEKDVCIVDAAKISNGSDKNPGVSRLAWDDIAIVGMAVELPGASDADTLWQNLVDGYQACSEIPSSRFNVNDYNNGKGSRTLNTRYGNFLENPFLFDAEHFGISRREAKSMDPQQRILLQTAYRALEDAGYVADTTASFARDTFGCWIGNATLDYMDNLRSDIDVYYSTGTLRAFLSARISYVFGWSGPSITLDTACSSSIVALHQAARSILAGDCRSALVGAANTITSPDYLGMGRELMEQYEDFAHTVNVCDGWLVKNNYPGCLAVITGEQKETEDDGRADAQTWQSFQSAIYVIEVALAKLLESWGIRPQAVAGHSLGEYAALVTAGVIRLMDGLKLVAHRAKLMMEQCKLGQTSMLAVSCSAAVMTSMIDASTDFGDLAISCNNSKTDCVIGGSVSQLVLLKKHLTDELQARSKLLDVPMAFHNAAMDPILEEFTAFAAREVRVSPPTLPVVSNVLGRTVAVGEQAFSPEYFARQCRGTVAFDDGIKHFLALGGSESTPYRWIEIGPHPSVQPMLRGRLGKAAPSHIQLTTLKKNVPFAVHAIQKLSHGVSNSCAIYETPAVLLKDFVQGHLVCGYALCPASVYHEMVLAALNDCQSAAGSSVVWGLSKVSYCAPMVYDGNSNQVLRVVITPHLTLPDRYDFAVMSYLAGTDPDERSTDCMLGGWSFGGVVAFEAARILMSRGHRVKGVVLIDSPPPIGHIPLSESIISAVTAQPAEKDAAAGPTTASKCVSPVASAIRKLVQQSFRICAGLIGDFGTSAELQQRGLSKPVGPVPRLILLRSAVGWTSPRGYTGAAVGDMENPWLQDRRDRSLATAGWEVLTGGPIQCVDIPGNHFQVFDAPNIAAVSAALVDACSEFELK
ncbi:hypothetical protein MY1884_007777 [Beauveria asiatica]